VRDQVSHPYKTTGRIVVLYILTFTFLDSRRDDKILRTEWYLHAKCHEKLPIGSKVISGGHRQTSDPISLSFAFK
jgi:hypothetical protein